MFKRLEEKLALPLNLNSGPQIKAMKWTILLLLLYMLMLWPSTASVKQSPSVWIVSFYIKFSGLKLYGMHDTILSLANAILSWLFPMLFCFIFKQKGLSWLYPLSTTSSLYSTFIYYISYQQFIITNIFVIYMAYSLLDLEWNIGPVFNHAA